jgi:GH25 family lysozyme M1 (1,4-beta-N-acetylmuramidase)
MVIGGEEVTNSANEFALHGVDVSEYQLPAAIPGDADFAVIRASIGGRADKRFALHVAHISGMGKCWAPYHFFYPGTSIAQQVDVLCEALRVVGYGAGCGIPWVDVEDTSGSGSNPPTPAWSNPLRQLIEALRAEFGECGSYVDQYSFAKLGKPAWLLERPLWCPHWRSTPGAPATAGDIIQTLWKYRVGPWKPGARYAGEATATGAIDHDCLVGKWPVVGGAVEAPKMAQQRAVLTEAEYSEMRSLRAHLVAA